MDLYRHYAGIVLPIIEIVVLFASAARVGYQLWRPGLPSDSLFLILLMTFLLTDSDHGEWIDLPILGGLAIGMIWNLFLLIRWDRRMEKMHHNRRKRRWNNNN